MKQKRIKCGLLSALLTAAMVSSASAASLPFTDVNRTDWFYSAVEYAYEQKLMSGTGNNMFSPHDTTTRGQVMTVLHHLEGSPDTEDDCKFRDVPEDAFYRQAVIWAESEDIVAGYSADTFGPDDPVTREQLTSIFYRYAKTRGYDVSQRADLSRYTDRDQISSFAVETVSWANAIGLIAGNGPDTLAPREGATRSQFASILMNFCGNPALAGEENRFVVRADRSADGQTIHLELRLEGKICVSGFDLRLNYDSGAVKLKQLNTEYGLPIFANADRPGQIAFNYVGIDNLTEAQTILTADFEVLSTESGRTKFGLQAEEVIYVDPDQNYAILQAPFGLIPDAVIL